MDWAGPGPSMDWARLWDWGQGQGHGQGQSYGQGQGHGHGQCHWAGAPPWNQALPAGGEAQLSPLQLAAAGQLAALGGGAAGAQLAAPQLPQNGGGVHWEALASLQPPPPPCPPGGGGGPDEWAGSSSACGVWGEPGLGVWAPEQQGHRQQAPPMTMTGARPVMAYAAAYEAGSHAAPPCRRGRAPAADPPPPHRPRHRPLTADKVALTARDNDTLTRKPGSGGRGERGERGWRGGGSEGNEWNNTESAEEAPSRGGGEAAPGPALGVGCAGAQRSAADGAVAGGVTGTPSGSTGWVIGVTGDEKPLSPEERKPGDIFDIPWDRWVWAAQGFRGAPSGSTGRAIGVTGDEKPLSPEERKNPEDIFDIPWHKLTADEKKAADGLGWVKGIRWPGGPTAVGWMARRWDSMSPGDQDRWRELGYDRQAWLDWDKSKKATAGAAGAAGAGGAAGGGSAVGRGWGRGCRGPQ